MIAKQIDVEDLDTQLTELLLWIKDGHEVVLTQHKQPVARMVPPAEKNGGRIPGLHAGSAWISDDFDAPLDDDFWASTP